MDRLKRPWPWDPEVKDFFWYFLLKSLRRWRYQSLGSRSYLVTQIYYRPQGWRGLRSLCQKQVAALSSCPHALIITQQPTHHERTRSFKWLRHACVVLVPSGKLLAQNSLIRAVICKAIAFLVSYWRICSLSILAWCRYARHPTKFDEPQRLCVWEKPWPLNELHNCLLHT